MPTTPQDLGFLRALQARLTLDPLRSDSPLYEPLYADSPEDDPVERMFATVALAPIESIQLLSGFSGSGKSTELLRLKDKLENAGCFVAYASAVEYLNPAEPIDIAELLIVLAAAFHEAVASLPGGAAPLDSVVDRVRNFLTRTEVRLSQAGVKTELETPLGDVLGKLKAGVELKLEFKTPSSFRRNLRRVLNNDLATLTQDLTDFYAEGVRRIRLEKGKDTTVVFLVDDLEKFRGGLLTPQDVIQSVERVFTLHFDRLRVPHVHVIYSVPPWLKFVARGGTPMEVLPTPHLWENDARRTPTPRNRDALMRLVLRRLGPDGQDRVFGQDALARNAALTRLIDMSGGHLRDLMRLLQEVVRRAAITGLPVTEAVVEAAVNTVRREFLPISQSDATWLARIERDRAAALPDADPAAADRLTRFLDVHWVLYFVNADEWYDVHPLIRDEVRRIAHSDDGGSGTAP